jgi:YggT family protein
MTAFIFSILSSIIGLLIFAIIASAVLSWLVAFNVINIRHPAARNVVYVLDAITRPVLWPFQRILPPLGGIDVSPILAIIVLQAARTYLLPWLMTPLAALTGG